MARPLKLGLDYFPHDTDAMGDEKLEALEAAYGNDGYAFYFKCLERIYRTENAELDLSLPGALAVLAAKVNVSQEQLQEMLKFSCEWGLFDSTIYKKRHLLTSNGIRKRAEIVIEAREQRRARYLKEKNVADKPPDKPPTNHDETPDTTGFVFRAKGKHSSKEKERKGGGGPLNEGDSEEAERTSASSIESFCCETLAPLAGKGSHDHIGPSVEVIVKAYPEFAKDAAVKTAVKFAGQQANWARASKFFAACAAGMAADQREAEETDPPRYQYTRLVGPCPHGMPGHEDVRRWNDGLLEWRREGSQYFISRRQESHPTMFARAQELGMWGVEG